MKIPIQELTLSTLNSIKENNSWSEHFNLVVWPRALFWLGMKDNFNEYPALNWKIHFTPDNMHNNFISMHIKDLKDIFNFYFQVPLVEKLSLNLYLGDSTYNFFEIHPLLISKGVFKKDELEVKATSTILPHLQLSTLNSKYDKATLWKINEINYKEISKSDPLISLLVYNFRRFISPLEKIINGEWTL